MEALLARLISPNHVLCQVCEYSLMDNYYILVFREQISCLGFGVQGTRWTSFGIRWVGI